MLMGRRWLLGAVMGASAPAVRAARQAPTIRIGVLTDQSGPNRDNTGMGSVVCAQQAIAEFGQAFPIQLIHADHQNKPDVAASIARGWLDRDGVDMILDVPTSPAALAVSTVAREKNKVMICSGAGSTDMTGPLCNANTVQWTFDTYMLSRSAATQVVRLGGKRWFFLTGDYVFGRQIERDASRFVEASGGSVVGSAVYPSPETTDFSSYLLRAKSSGADVICFTIGGRDTINGVKQAHEFGLGATTRIAALAASPADVRAIGQALAQGLYLTATYYWDLNDRTRAFNSRVLERMPQRQPPTSVQAGCYSGTLHFLRAVAAKGAGRAKLDGAGSVAQMKAMPVADDAFGAGLVRADGRATFPVHLLQVKAPQDMGDSLASLRLVATTPAGEAWRPLNEGGCPLVKL